MTLSINNPAAGTKVSGVIQLSGQSAQSVQGSVLSAQPFTVNYDVSKLLGTSKITLQNSSGDTASVSLICNVAPSGTLVTADGVQFSDDNGDLWSLKSGVVQRNGAPAGNNWNMTNVLYYNQAIYSVNTSGDWYTWNGSSWNHAADPRPSASLDGAYTTPGGPALHDSSLNAWTVNTSGQVARNGVVDQTTGGVILLYAKGGAIYSQNTLLDWYKPNGFPGQVATTDPRPALPFYGINMHPDYIWTAAQMVQRCQQIGAKTIRFDTWGYDTSKVPHIADLMNSIAALDPTIKILPCITSGPDYTKSEQTNYNAAFTGAKYVAQVLSATGINDFECGNELFSPLMLDQTAAGDYDDTFDNTKWPALRGHIRGLIAGVKAAAPAARCYVNFTIAQISASDMCWNGRQPDGSTGHPIMRWDVTSWHSYKPYGDPTSMGTQNHGSNFNLLAYVSNAYKRPIRITEYNSDNANDDTGGSTWVQGIMNSVYGCRSLYGVEGLDFYQADGGYLQYGLFFFAQKTQTYINFVANNPA